jgi:hypothetical protein
LIVLSKESKRIKPAIMDRTKTSGKWEIWKHWVIWLGAAEGLP